MPVFERPTVALHYEDTGGDNPALVFLHGWCDGRESWTATLEHFRGAYRCVAPDMRGHGLSGLPRDHAYFPEALSGDVVALCEFLGVSRPVLIGHSFGGMLAGFVAARFPGFARAVVVEDQALDLRPLAGQLRQVEPVIFSADQHMGFRDGLFDSMVTDRISAEDRAGIQRLKRATPVEVGQALWAPLFALTGAELGTMAERLIGGLAGQPSLLIDAQPQPGYYEQVRAIAPDVEVEVLVCGHWTHLERAGEFRAAVSRFLERVSD